MTGRAFFRSNGESVQLPGGCADCNAFRTLDASEAPVYVLLVHHDDTCPTYRASAAHQEAT